jgi:hypothetical protein
MLLRSFLAPNDPRALSPLYLGQGTIVVAIVLAIALIAFVLYRPRLRAGALGDAVALILVIALVVIVLNLAGIVA